jgi:hypothetical protein
VRQRAGDSHWLAIAEGSRQPNGIQNQYWAAAGNNWKLPINI